MRLAGTDPLLCRCGGPRRYGQRNCLKCHAESMRRTRPKHSELSPIARWKANARAYMNVYVGRGIIERGPCEVCGTRENIHGHHHAGYDRPLWVRWLCAKHHREEHQAR